MKAGDKVQVKIRNCKADGFCSWAYEAMQGQ